MYQASIRDKKKHKQFQQLRSDNYELNPNFEEYAYVKKLLGNCRVQIITDSGTDAIGVIRGSMRKFNKRVIIENGDIVVVSKRDFQTNKVDIVHKYNQDQIQYLINEKKLSSNLINMYNYYSKNDNDTITNNNDNYIDFGDIDEYINDDKPHNLNRKYDDDEILSDEEINED